MKQVAAGQCKCRQLSRTLELSRTLVLGFVVFLTLVLQAVSSIDSLDAAAAVSVSACVLEEGVDLCGGDLPAGHIANTNSDVPTCTSACLARKECTHFTVIRGACYLKNSDKGRSINKGGVSATCTHDLVAAAGTESTDDSLYESYLLPVNSTIGRIDDTRQRSKSTCITVHKGSEGFGMNLKIRMDAVGEARKMGGWYCHSNQTNVTHHVDHELANVVMGFPGHVDGCGGCKVVGHHLKEKNPYGSKLLTKTIKRELQAIFNRGDRSSPDSCRFDAAKENIAVHIRRGDVMKLKPNKKKEIFIPNSQYAEIFQIVRMKNRKYGSPKALLFHIFSEGPDEDFETLLSPCNDVVLHNKDGALSSFRCMVTAARLIPAASSFSQTAAVLSYGIVYNYDKIMRNAKQYTSNMNIDTYYEAGMVRPPPAPYPTEQLRQHPQPPPPSNGM